MLVLVLVLVPLLLLLLRARTYIADSRATQSRIVAPPSHKVWDGKVLVTRQDAN